MKRLKLVSFIFVLIFSVNSYGQNNKSNKFCQEDFLGKTFISDGLDHQVLVKKGKPSKFYVVFYPQFKYKLVICSNNKELPIEFKLFDNNGTVFFSNEDKKYTREWEFQYASIMNAVVELQIAGENIKEESVRLIIGYQSIKNQ